MPPLLTRASSINRALDQVGDRWCLLILQEIFWGVNSFNGMLQGMGVSRGVLSDRLKWLQSIDCLRKDSGAGRRQGYHMTAKSVELYDVALMALAWERRFHRNAQLDRVALVHSRCGQAFQPEMRCRHCCDPLLMEEVSYRPGPGATQDARDKKVRRRSSQLLDSNSARRGLYLNVINLLGDRWTANLIALAFHGLKRFDEFHEELPVATNILADRLKFLVEQQVFETVPYQQRPLRHEYQLTQRGAALYPLFLALLQWGDRWCDPDGRGKPMRLRHEPCGRSLHGQVVCNACGGVLKAHQVQFTLE